MPQELDAQTKLHLKKTRESLHKDFDSLHPAERIDSILDDSIDQIRGDADFDRYEQAGECTVVLGGQPTGLRER